MRNTAAVLYVAAKSSGEVECPIPDCGLPVRLAVDHYGVCRYTGGCSHFVNPERWDGKLMAGFADEVA